MGSSEGSPGCQHTNQSDWLPGGLPSCMNKAGYSRQLSSKVGYLATQKLNVQFFGLDGTVGQWTLLL